MEKVIDIKRKMQIQGIDFNEGDQLIFSEDSNIVFLLTFSNEKNTITPLVQPFTLGGNSYGLKIWNSMIKISRSEGWEFNALSNNS